MRILFRTIFAVTLLALPTAALSQSPAAINVYPDAGHAGGKWGDLQINKGGLLGGITLPGQTAGFFRGDGAFAPSGLRYITNTYAASGAIAPTDDIAAVSSASAVVMTLAAGTVDGKAIEVKRLGAGTVTVTAVIDGVSQTVTMNTGSTIKESLSLRWIAALTTYISY